MSKQQRADHANQLIGVIASHGRRFFYYAPQATQARLEVDARGRVWFTDEYTGRRIYTHQTPWGNKWRGFSHGGTLRSLVEAMRDYIRTGKPIGPGWIAPERSFSDGDIWGYGPEAAQAVREATKHLAIITGEIQA